MVVACALAASMCGGDDNPTGPSNTGPIVFTAALSGANEVPPITGNEANGRGNATLTMNVPRDSSGNPTGGGSFNFSAQITGLPGGTNIILGHIHEAASGVNGPVRVNTDLSAASPFTLDNAGNGNLVFNDKAVPADVAQRIYANPAGFYVNFHSIANQGGVVRGQLVRTQ
jgi:hypothetical protein